MFYNRYKSFIHPHFLVLEVQVGFHVLSRFQAAQ